MELGALQAAAELYVGILAVTILVAATNAGVLGVSRLVYSMGMHRQMPDGMRRLHPRFRTPYLGILAFSAAACLALLPGPGRLPRRDLRVRRDALVLDGAPRGAAAAGHASPTSSARTAARAASGSAATTCRRSRCSASPAPALSLLVVSALDLTVAAAGSAWLALGIVVYVVYRRRQGLDLVSTHKVAIAEPVVDHEAEYDSVLVHVGDDRYDERLIATAAKLAAQRRRGIHVLVTITVPNALEIDAAMPEAEAAADSIIEQAQAAGRPARVRALGEGPRRPAGPADHRGGAATCAPPRSCWRCRGGSPARPCSARRSRPCWPSGRAA